MNVVFNYLIHEVSRTETHSRFGLTFCGYAFTLEFSTGRTFLHVFSADVTRAPVNCAACIGLADERDPTT